MDWIKRNCDWLMQAIFCLALIAALGWLTWATRLTAHAQKPEPGMRRDDPNLFKWSNSANFHEPLFILREKSGWEIGPGLWQQIESHCVAVLTEKRTVHHKLEPTPPSFDDRAEWDDVIPEQTLKLRCTAEQEKK